MMTTVECRYVYLVFDLACNIEVSHAGLHHQHVGTFAYIAVLHTETESTRSVASKLK